jgi:uncharacterized membrane protein (DUF106 family)
MVFDKILDPVLNPVLQPLLNASPFWGIVILSLVISLIITIIYKYVTDQTKMKALKDKQKDFQKRIKELRSNPPEMMKVQKEAMSTNMEYMKHSFKPTLFTMIPILLIFGWMAGHLSYEPIYPGEMYSVTASFGEGIVGEAELIPTAGTILESDAIQTITAGMITWNLKSDAGEHLLTVKKGETEQNKAVLITTELKTEDALSVYEHSEIKQVQINYNKLKPLGSYSIFGWHPGWLGLYIIFSLVFSIGLRKVMKIY